MNEGVEHSQNFFMRNSYVKNLYVCIYATNKDCPTTIKYHFHNSMFGMNLKHFYQTIYILQSSFKV